MPAEQTTENIAQRQNYRRLFCVEGLLLLTSCVTLGHGGKAGLLIWTMLSLWHVVVIPICVLYLIGKPVVMTLSPLIPTAESRAYRRELRKRDQLDDDSFYRRFYDGTEIPPELMASVRRGLIEVDSLMPRAVPSDQLFLIDDELDFADVLDAVGQQLGVDFVKSDYERIDGTLDNLIRVAHAKTLERIDSIHR